MSEKLKQRVTCNAVGNLVFNFLIKFQFEKDFKLSQFLRKRRTYEEVRHFNYKFWHRQNIEEFMKMENFEGLRKNQRRKEQKEKEGVISVLYELMFPHSSSPLSRKRRRGEKRGKVSERGEMENVRSGPGLSRRFHQYNCPIVWL